jgi:predicted alpha/beta hydrolase
VIDQTVRGSLYSSPPSLVERRGAHVASRTEIQFLALDGHELRGTVYLPQGFSSNSTVAAIICGGAGVSASKYRRFAEFLAAAGIPVLTFDYRGIGKSRPRSLRQLIATAEDWAEHDVGGAIAYAASRFDSCELVGVAHSIGAFLIGGATNISVLTRLLFIAPHTGYVRDYRPKYRIPMALLWHVVMPVLTRACGYFPAHRLGLGEDLPKGVALQWAARRTPDFRPDSSSSQGERGRAMLSRIGALKLPIMSFAIEDDAFATQQGARRLLATYESAAPVTSVAVSPKEFSRQEIGHFGFFRKQIDDALWAMVANRIAGRQNV